MQSFHFIKLLRGIAALWVLVAHCVIWSGYQGLPIPSPKLAVDLFMMISGFLMANIAQNFELKSGHPFMQSDNIVRFYLNRLFRIAPAYYISLLLVVVLQEEYLAGYSTLRAANIDFWKDKATYDPSLVVYSAGNLLAHVTFIFGLIPKYSFATFLPDWSLSLEMQFYAVFPFIYLISRKVSIDKTVALLGGVSITFALTYYAATKLKWIGADFLFPEPSFLLLKLPYFLAGMVLHTWLGEPKRQRRRHLAVLAIALVSWELSYRFSLLWLTFLAGSFLILAEYERKNQAGTWYFRWIRSSFIDFMSDCSYGVYLFHGFFVSLIGSFLIRQHGPLTTPSAFVTFLMLVLLSAYLMAYLVHRFIEQPGIRWGRLLAARMPSATALP